MISDTTLLKALAASQRFAEELGLDPQLVTTIRQNKPGFSSALAADEGRLAIALGANSQLAKAVARDRQVMIKMYGSKCGARHLRRFLVEIDMPHHLSAC